MNETFAQRAVIVTSILVGLIAYDAWRYRRGVVRFARFTGLWNRPDAVAHDRSYQEAVSANNV